MVELVAVADSALVRPDTAALLRVLSVLRITRKLTWTTTEHLDVHRQAFVDTNWIDLQNLIPVTWILRTLQQGYVGFELNKVSNLKTITLTRLHQRTITLTAGVVFYVNQAVRTVVLHLNRRRYFIILVSYQRYNVRRIVRQHGRR